MTPNMIKANHEFEERLSMLVEGDPEAVAIADLWDKQRMSQLLFERVGVPFTAADLIEMAKLIFGRQLLEAQRLAAEALPIADNILTSRPCVAVSGPGGADQYPNLIIERGELRR